MTEHFHFTRDLNCQHITCTYRLPTSNPFKQTVYYYFRENTSEFDLQFPEVHIYDPLEVVEMAQPYGDEFVTLDYNQEISESIQSINF
jgi:hypothetical protein